MLWGLLRSGATSGSTVPTSTDADIALARLRKLSPSALNEAARGYVSQANLREAYGNKTGRDLAISEEIRVIDMRAVIEPDAVVLTVRAGVARRGGSATAPSFELKLRLSDAGLQKFADHTTSRQADTQDRGVDLVLRG